MIVILFVQFRVERGIWDLGSQPRDLGSHSPRIRAALHHLQDLTRLVERKNNRQTIKTMAPGPVPIELHPIKIENEIRGFKEVQPYPGLDPGIWNHNLWDQDQQTLVRSGMRL